MSIRAHDERRGDGGRLKSLGGAFKTLTSQVAPYVIELLLDRDVHIWDKFAASHPRGSVCHQTIWRELIKRLFGNQSYYLCARHANGKMVGILPLVRLKSRLFGNFLTSMPYLNYGGAIAIDGEIEEALMNRAGELAESLGCRHVEFRDKQERADRWPVRTDKVIMELELPDSPEILWTDLGSKVRAQIKRPAKEGMKVVRGGKELLGDFYAVFARNMRDLGTPVYPVGLFALTLDSFPDTATIIAVKRGNQSVAAGFLLGFGDRLEIPWASSLLDFNRFGVNMLLYWEALTFAIEAGYRVFDFGRSTRESGTHRFKAQWGGTEKQLYWHYWLRHGQDIPYLTPSNPRYKLAVKVWRHLPIFLTNRLGPMIVKNLP